MIDRRHFAKRLAGAMLDHRRGLLAAMPGMLSAGYIARRGHIVRRHIDGMALHPGGRWSPFAYDQPLRLASVSKMITTIGFMHVADGAIDLDADASTYLRAPLRHPAFPAAPITCRMLLSHTSGLRNGADFPVPFNNSLLDRLSRASSEPDFGGWFAPATEPPGGWFAYSDTNFAVIAEIVERVTGQRFDRYMRQLLFVPLGLDIGYNWSGVSPRKRARAAAACRWIDGAWSAQVDAAPPPAPAIAFYRAEGDATSTEADYHIGENGFAFAPHGGLRVSLSDMDALARFCLRPQTEGVRRALAQMATRTWISDPTTPNGSTENGFYQAYGLGMQTPLGRPIDSFFGADSADWRGHCGDAYGWMTGIWWNAGTNTTLVYAINGMPETDRPRAVNTALTAPEQAVIDAALADLAHAS